jgi:hypothetical protein
MAFQSSTSLQTLSMLENSQQGAPCESPWETILPPSLPEKPHFQCLFTLLAHDGIMSMWRTIIDLGQVTSTCDKSRSKLNRAIVGCSLPSCHTHSSPNVEDHH